jgi:DNA-binding response OmpR family regulator
MGGDDPCLEGNAEVAKDVGRGAHRLPIGVAAHDHADKRIVTAGGKTVSLTPSEFTLLQTLMASPGRVYTRSDLIDRLYEGGESVVDRVVDVHIGKLRRKIENAAGQPRYIETVHGIGYRFADAEPGT